MLARPGGQKEHYDYDNPTLEASMTSMNYDRGEEGPRMMSSHESLDAGVVRPAMINIIPGDDIIAAPQSPDALLPESQAALPPGDDMEKPSKLKGFFGKKDKDKKEKDKKEKKEKKEKEKKEKKDKKEKKKEEDQNVDVDVERAEPGPDDIEVLEEIPLPEPPKGSTFGSKLKGLFKGKGGGESEPVVTTPSSDGAGGAEVANPAYDYSMPTSPVDSPTGVGENLPTATYSTDPVPQTKSRPLTSLLRKPPLPPPDPEAEPVAELRVIPDSSHVRCSTFLNCVLLLGIFLGILFLILNGVNYNPTLAVIGPVFLGLSVFALIGKTFITLFWQEDPLPRLKPYVNKFEAALGPKGDVRPVSKHAVIARSSHYGMQYDVNYGQYPTQQVVMAEEPRRYGMGYTDEPIDTTPRQPPREYFHQSQPTEEIAKAPTFI